MRNGIADTNVVPQLASPGQDLGSAVRAVHMVPAVDVVGIAAGVPHGEDDVDAVGIQEGDVGAGEDAVGFAGEIAGAGLCSGAGSEGRVD